MQALHRQFFESAKSQPDGTVHVTKGKFTVIVAKRVSVAGALRMCCRYKDRVSYPRS